MVTPEQRYWFQKSVYLLAFSASEQGGKFNTYLIKVEYPSPLQVNLKASEQFFNEKQGFRNRKDF